MPLACPQRLQTVGWCEQPSASSDTAFATWLQSINDYNILPSETLLTGVRTQCGTARCPLAPIQIWQVHGMHMD